MEGENDASTSLVEGMGSMGLDKVEEVRRAERGEGEVMVEGGGVVELGGKGGGEEEVEERGVCGEAEGDEEGKEWED